MWYNRENWKKGKTKMNIKANKKNILVGIIVVIIIGIIGIVCYDRITVNNQYYIGEKNLEIPIFVYHNILRM